MKFSKRILSLILAMTLLLSVIPTGAAAAGDVKYGIAFTKSNLRLRSEANESAKSLTTASKGEVVLVLEKADLGWYKVSYNGQEGYMSGTYLNVKTTGNAELGYGTINATKVNLRKGPGTSHSVVAVGNIGSSLYVVGIEDGWYRVIFNSVVGYIRSDFVDLNEVPYENKASSKSPLFYRGNESTGVEVSASALNGTTSSESKPATSESTTSSNASTSTSTNSTTAATSTDEIHGIAFVTGSGLRLRSTPNTSGSTLASASKGEVVVVLEQSGEWYKVLYNLKEGYMHSDYLNVQTTGNAELGYGVINGSSVNLRSTASTSGKRLATGNKGDQAYILGVENGWYQVIFADKVCFVRSDFLDLTQIPYENKSSSNTPIFYRGGNSTGVEVSASALNGTTDKPASSGSTSSSTSSNNSTSSSNTSASTAKPSGSVTGSQIVETAKKYLGVPYVYGGSTPSGFDCSGLVYYVLKSHGIKVSRSSAAMYSCGTPISKSDLQPGDLVFFQGTYKAGISHVGIYVGNGKFIHSPQRGDVVSFADLNSAYYTAHYYGSIRVV